MGGTTRRVLIAALAALAALLVLAFAGLAARGGGWTAELPHTTAAPTPALPTRTFTPPPVDSATPTAPPAPGSVLEVSGWIYLGALLLLVVCGLVALAGLVRRPRWRHEPAPAGMSAAPADAALPAAVERALELIDDPDAREAVVRAWLLLGEAAAAAGTPARPAETAAEYARRLAAELGLPRPSVERLAELYREARFSDHEVRPEQREQARAELYRLRAVLAGSGAEAR